MMVHIKLPPNAKAYNNKHVVLARTSASQLSWFQHSLGFCTSARAMKLEAQGELPGTFFSWHQKPGKKSQLRNRHPDPDCTSIPVAMSEVKVWEIHSTHPKGPGTAWMPNTADSWGEGHPAQSFNLLHSVCKILIVQFTYCTTED